MADAYSHSSIVDVDSLMSAVIQVIKDLCSPQFPDAGGKAAAPAIEPLTMRAAFATVLDGGASDLEIGALMTASALLEAHRAADGFTGIVLGLSDAIRDRMTPLCVDSGSAQVVVLPNYGEESAFPAMPLLALLLRRMGVRVLVHGAVETQGGLHNCCVFREFGVLPAATRGQAARQIAETGLALLPVTLFSPGLAAMLSLRNRLGVRTPAHSLANMLMPVADTSTRSLHVLHMASWLRPSLADESVVLEAPALIVSATESAAEGILGQPWIAFRDGEVGAAWQSLFDRDSNPTPPEFAGRTPTGPALEACDPRAWAAWTHQRLAAKAALPSHVANLLACCLYGCGYASDINQAKAIVAIEPGSLVAA
ncbi:MAG: hypothetical protein ABI790_00135 [Betaproteobacteria bacterium]